MNVLMRISAKNSNLSVSSAIVQLTALQVDDSWNIHNNMTITVALNNRSGPHIYSAKKAGMLLDNFLKHSDRLCWLSQEELDLFLRNFRRYLNFRISTNSVLLQSALSSLRECIEFDADADLAEVMQQLKKAANTIAPKEDIL